jgi:hypothetical protein
MGRRRTDEEQGDSSLPKQRTKTIQERVHHLECAVEFLLSEIMNTRTAIQSRVLEKISRHRLIEEAMKSREKGMPELGGSHVHVHKRKHSWEPDGTTPTVTKRNTQNSDYLRGFPPRHQESPCESGQFIAYSPDRGYGRDARRIKTEHSAQETVSAIDTVLKTPEVLNIAPQPTPTFSITTTPIVSDQTRSQTPSSAFSWENGHRGHVWTQPVLQEHDNLSWLLQPNDVWRNQW